MRPLTEGQDFPSQALRTLWPMSAPGPAALGRAVIVEAGGAAPPSVGGAPSGS